MLDEWINWTDLSRWWPMAACERNYSLFGDEKAMFGREERW